ncbi:MAG: UxaA family hydrolase [Anaerolineae bacterium]|jgi:altronate dehydratase|nr:UxaA family hydrolase [Anaerolineae bacterium]
MEILGYERPDGQIGIRNKVSIIFSTDCSRYVAQKLKTLFPEGTQLFGYPGGCAMVDGAFHKLVALGNHSGSAAALVIGLGCEGTDAYGVAEAIAATGRPAEAVKINEAGGDLRTVEEGSRILARLLQHTSQSRRVPMTPGDLIVGTECGGSDATSGLASNPVTGVVGDRLIDAGGTYMISELEELLGCSDILATRATNGEVAEDVRGAITAAERRSFESGRFAWGYGNIMGGLTSIEEKSYGALAKSGTKPLQGILRDYGLPPRKGFFLQVGEPGSGFFHGDPEGINQFAAHGAHLALFTTGCGSTTGGLIPVVKVIANPNRMQLIRDNADFDATPIILGERTVQEMGDDLYAEVLAVAAGKLTRSEIFGHFEV